MVEMQREIVVMKKMDHPNVVRLFEVVDDPNDDKMLMVMEYVNGGAVMEGSGEEMKPISEDTARRHFRDVLKGLEYMHFNNIIHRDLKPENLLLTAEGCVKISDFGNACHRADGDDMMDDTSGTRPFFAPEMCSEDGRRFSGKKADVYALGVCLYMFVHGKVPFQSSESVLELFEKIRTKEVDFPDVEGRQLSKPLKNLLKRLLDKNPDTRIGLVETMEDDWVTKGGSLGPIQSSWRMELDHINVSEEERTAAVTPSIEAVFDNLPEMSERTYKKGQYIVQKGLPTEGLFLIKEGMCEVVAKDDGEDDDPLSKMVSVDLDFATNVEPDSDTESENSQDMDTASTGKSSIRSLSGKNPQIKQIGSMDRRHVRKHVLKTTTRTFAQMKGLVNQSFNDRIVNVSEKSGNEENTVSRGPGSILGILALENDGRRVPAKETIVAVQQMKVAFVSHEALCKYFKGQDSHLQVRLLMMKLQHVALMRNTVEKFAVLNSEMQQIEELRKVSRHKVSVPPVAETGTS
ncbi:hypothetical protein BSKO_07983 [Bryopsis sp. KO-2023]|nr:hypothetical protein BSKO_07983 [Bryopsis sp. KO-2023]